ncbi:MAG: hypothetical protein QNJ81_13865 [Acidimicrobiia bacterium]|nr:hypothetical protein [Acidimicrobiia bacterium]
MAVPDVILIGGPPGAGKTTLGRALGARLGYGSTTVDDLSIAARWFSTPESHPSLHVMESGGHTTYFTDSSVERLVSDAEALSEEMWPAIERIIRSHLTLKGPVVLDWWLFSPKVVATLGDQVGSIWLWVEPTELERREQELAPPFVEGSADPERMMANFMARSLWRNDLVRAEAGTHGLPVLIQDGSKDVEVLVDEALGLLGYPGTRYEVPDTPDEVGP